MNDKNILKKFGQLIVEEVRDNSMETMILDYQGKFNTECSKKFHEKMTNNISEEIYNEICLKAIDSALFNLLIAIEENSPQLLVEYMEKNVVDSSDGLGGDYLGDWIPNFSKYPNTENV